MNYTITAGFYITSTSSNASTITLSVTVTMAFTITSSIATTITIAITITIPIASATTTTSTSTSSRELVRVLSLVHSIPIIRCKASGASRVLAQGLNGFSPIRIPKYS